MVRSSLAVRAVDAGRRDEARSFHGSLNMEIPHIGDVINSVCIVWVPDLLPQFRVTASHVRKDFCGQVVEDRFQGFGNGSSVKRTENLMVPLGKSAEGYI